MFRNLFFNCVMNIMQRVEQIKRLAVTNGDYRQIAEKSGVTYHWLQKFARGGIANPTVSNVAKLEQFFRSSLDDAA